jgi:single-strand DNA-binding protein
MNLNRVFFGGRLVRDPELRSTSTGMSVCSFTIACGRKYKTKTGHENDETCFLDCTMFAKRGEAVAEHFRKGSEILIDGRLVTDKWTDKEGHPRSKVKAIAENFHFVGQRPSVEQKRPDIPKWSNDDIPF